MLATSYFKALTNNKGFVIEEGPQTTDHKR